MLESTLAGTWSPRNELVGRIMTFLGTSDMHRQKDSVIVGGRTAVNIAQFVPHEDS